MLDTRLELERSNFERPETVIHLFIGGSELHGAKVGATDDLDIYGVFLDPPPVVLGLNPRKHFVWSTASDDRRNGPEDVDLTLYSLRRWAQLAAKGNATALHFVFADSITGEQGRGAKGRRPEYESVFGYDTKAAMHCLRLYLECIELMRFGTITLPRPDQNYLIEARSGAWTLERFLAEAERLRSEAEDAAKISSLPESVDLRAISSLLAKAHLAAWQM